LTAGKAVATWPMASDQWRSGEFVGKFYCITITSFLNAFLSLQEKFKLSKVSARPLLKKIT
jgi:hypothetical protein